MKTQIVPITLVGDTAPTYFVDYSYGDHWKNSGSFDSREKAIQHIKELNDANTALDRT